MKYKVVNLGQVQGHDVIKPDEFNAFYWTALDAMSEIAQVARALSPSEEQISVINLATGKVRDYTVATVPCPACEAPVAQKECPVCQTQAAAAPKSDNKLLYAALALVAGGAVGYFVL